MRFALIDQAKEQFPVLRDVFASARAAISRERIEAARFVFTEIGGDDLPPTEAEPRYYDMLDDVLVAA
jgi:hypothetical protein